MLRMQKVTPGSSGIQHAPTHGLGLQVNVPGSIVPAGHGPVKMKQALRSQHAWVSGQVLGVQVLPGAGVVPEGHGPANEKHEPSVRQQARTHGFGMHVAEPGSMVPAGHGPNQMKHEVTSQQARDCGHGFGLHETPPR